MTEILNISKDWKGGLGTTIGVICTALDYKVKKINISNSFSKFFNEVRDIVDIHKVLKINDVEEYPTSFSVYPSDIFKAFSPYPKIALRKINKPCIGLCLYNGNVGKLVENPSLKFPEFRYYSSEQYLRLCETILKWGYDIITLNEPSISLEQKKYLIENYCECVIGYEGGIAHLCHILDVPYIMFPWRVGHDSFAKLVHMDDKTFFLDSFEQLLEISKKDFTETIQKLHEGFGNHDILNDKAGIIKYWCNFNNFSIATDMDHTLTDRLNEKIFLMSNPYIKQLFELYDR